MKSPHSYILPDNKKEYLWRYMSFSKFFDFISTSTLYFCRLDKFIDEFEGIMTPSTEEIISQYFGEYPNRIEMQEQLTLILKSIRNVTFTNCWHLDEQEDKLMWDTYTIQSEGIVIKTTPRKLISSFYDSKLGPMHFRPVKYACRIKDQIDLSDPLELLNFKDEKYEFENEFRISLMYLKEDFENFKGRKYTVKAPAHGVKIPVNLKKLISAVIVSPSSPPWFFNLVNALTNQVTGKKAFHSKL